MTRIVVILCLILKSFKKYDLLIDLLFLFSVVIYILNLSSLVVISIIVILMCLINCI